ncbi:HIT family protein [Vreelandella andesensis]|uniref:HIT family protein n=1 Tax=Vreelandella andesensis TaxID=447567 RepID=A0A3S0W640_9GAMM|nr:HIT family protein [Halomonas andesensis]RUR29710.1 HIT family protein [Halomonas andesensis]
MKEIDKFNKKFITQALGLFAVGSWKVSVRPVQLTPGSMVLSLQREVFSLGDLVKQEAIDMSIAIKEIERILSIVYSPDKINYLALMMIDPIVHFHVIPRYSKSVDISSVSYHDSFWPKPVDLLKQNQSMPSPETVANDLRNYISS